MSLNDSQDPLAAAKQAERDLNSYQAKQGLNSTSDSGIFPLLLSSPSLPSLLSITTHPPPQNRSIMLIALTFKQPNESGVNEYSPFPFPFLALYI